jgi:tRNA 2-(methylsulfanyl)-N6-isopentenyladenosine37 hydroxylase
MQDKDKRVLSLGLATEPTWVNLAEKQLADILTDHAYCEQKAATTCISLIQKYPEKTLLVDSLAPIVTEEWGHFRMVLRELKKRDLPLGAQRKDEYVNQLRQFIRKGGSPEQHLLDQLIVCAMIEARSCERFRLLSLNLQAPELRDFYHQFMVAEAGHYKLFLDLAIHYTDEPTARARWQACIAFEAQLFNTLETRGDRIH